MRVYEPIQYVRFTKREERAVTNTAAMMTAATTTTAAPPKRHPSPNAGSSVGEDTDGSVD